MQAMVSSNIADYICVSGPEYRRCVSGQRNTTRNTRTFKIILRQMMGTLKMKNDPDMIWPELPVQIVITGKPPDNSETESVV